MIRKLLLSNLLITFLLVLMVLPVSAEWIPSKQKGGPVVLLGIDAEDDYGETLQHGSLSAYKKIVDEIQSHVMNGKNDILVIGAGKSYYDHVTSFWRDLSRKLTYDVTFVNGYAIRDIKIENYGLLVIVSDVGNTPDGGLKPFENDILTSKQEDIGRFINNGGGLLGFASSFEEESVAYGYIPGIKVEVDVDAPNTVHTGYKDIEVVDNDWKILKEELELCCWHDVFLDYPKYLKPLALNKYYSDNTTIAAAAIGGADVIVDDKPPITTINIQPSVKKGKNGWFNSQDNVSFTLNAIDKLSSVIETKYRINNGSWVNYSVGDQIPVKKQGSSIKIDYYSIDDKENTEEVNTKYIKIDRTPPNINSIILPYSPNENGWYNSKTHQVSIKLVTSDNLSGVDKTYIQTNPMNKYNEYISPLNLDLKEGTNKVHYYTEDKAGNITQDDVELKADLTNPITTHEITPESANNWHNRGSNEVKVTLNSRDNLSGVDKTYFKTETMKDFEEYGEAFNISLKEGINKVSYYSIDKAGNIEEEKKIEIKADLTSPITRHSISPEKDWYNLEVNIVKVNLVGIDNLSGVEKTFYKTESMEEFKEYNGAFDVSLKEGTNKISYYSVDIAGNIEEEKNFELQADLTKPVTVHNINPLANADDWYNLKTRDIRVTLNGTDNLSGVEMTYYKTESMEEFEEYTGIFNLTLKEGINKVSYYSIDNAGNSEDEKTIELRADLTNPKTTHTISPDSNENGWNNSDVTLILLSEDNSSGVDYTEYNLGNGWEKYNGEITISQEGIQNIQYRSVDIAGNVEEEKSTVIKIDKTVPSIKPSSGDILWPPNHKMVDINIDIVTEDTLSGVEHWELVSIESNEPQDGIGDGHHSPDFEEAEFGEQDVQFKLRSERSGKGEGRKYTITYKVIDKAGNASTGTTVIEVPHDQSNKKKGK